ncbi:hypothetical protein NHX12_009957 [Muraenolepis orangiensis]|uniref:HP domain-containing protein n=1 Tax=Muraenolepis orangiensis TaxID=630683 RepID=A0A9Q0DIM5_9TELE|nr:hypothetical protein NHX12_009957 [Muraenolepis orangiensis]
MEKKLRTKADSGVLKYKRLASFPGLKAAHDIQRPDVIPYHAHLSDHALTQPYNAGQPLPIAAICIALVFSSGSSHANRAVWMHGHASPIAVSYPCCQGYANQSRSSGNLNTDARSIISGSNCNDGYHPDSNYYPHTGSPKVSRVRRFSSGGDDDGSNLNLNKGIGRMILKEEMKARSGCYDNDQWGSGRCSRNNSKEALHNMTDRTLNGYTNNRCASLPGYGRNGINRPGSAGGDSYQYDSHNSVNWQIKEYKRHLSPEDFHRVFGMSTASFDHLAQWKKKELKKQVRLF